MVATSFMCMFLVPYRRFEKTLSAPNAETLIIINVL